MLAFIGFVRAYWKPLCILALVITAIVTLEAWGNSREKEGYSRAKAEAALELAKWREHEREVDAEVVGNYVANISQLETRVASMQQRGPIRLCQSTNQVRQPDSTGTVSDPTGGSTVQAGPDIGPELWQYGGSCEDLRQKLIAIKAKIEHR